MPVINIGFKGINVLQTGSELIFDALLQDSALALLGTGTTTFRLYELQSDGTIKSYDFNDNTFKTTALTTPTLAGTHRPGNNGTYTTGLWTAALSTLTGFTVGGMYYVEVNNTSASPPDQMRKFMYGSAEGDMTVTANGTGVGEIGADVNMWLGSIPSALVSLATTAAAIRDVNNTAPAANSLGAVINTISGKIVTFPLATVVGTPTTISVDVTGLADTTLNAYKDGYAVFLTGGLTGATANPVAASSNAAGTTTLAFGGLLTAPSAGDTLIIVGSKK